MLDGQEIELNNIDSPLYEAGAKGRKIEKSSLTPINDPNCEHQWIDDDDEIGDMRAQVCAKCPLGRWVLKADA